MTTPELLVLYGPPASGKDTITAELARRDPRFHLYRRLKCGPGRTTGYRMITAEELTHLRCQAHRIIWENSRYNAVYLVDREQLLNMIDTSLIPVLHLGQQPAIEAVKTALPTTQVLVVELSCRRETAAARIAARHTGDEVARLAAYDATPHLPVADLTIDTTNTSPAAAAAAILALSGR